LKSLVFPRGAGRRGVVVAAATPCGSVVLHADGWPDVDEAAAAQLDKGDPATPWARPG
jgi:hypothetical protein